MSTKLAHLTLNVPYKRAGNIIRQEPVEFDLYQDGDDFRLVPLLGPDDLRIANLPPVLVFTIVDGKPVSSRGKRDGNFHVIQDAVAQLAERGQPIA